MLPQCPGEVGVESVSHAYYVLSVDLTSTTARWWARRSSQGAQPMCHLEVTLSFHSVKLTVPTLRG